MLGTARQTVTITVFKLAPSGSEAESQRALHSQPAMRGFHKLCQRISEFRRKSAVPH